LLHERKAVTGTIPAEDHSTDASKDTKPSDKDTSPTNPDDTPSGTPESPKDGDTPTAPPASGAAPAVPYGNFVSNHHPNLDGAPAPSTVESVCNTTPGALCRIDFTNADGIVKTLENRKADVNGAVYWSWDVAKAGLTVGPWKITVTATLNGQSKTANGTQNLEVSP
jgi:hypothetical protein